MSTKTKIEPAPLQRTLREIALEIRQDYAAKGKPVYFAAVPYVDALVGLDTRDLSAKYYEDDADDVIVYLLGNLIYWRGETATRVKAELTAALADHKINLRGAL
jgi:hypothetical protein